MTRRWESGGDGRPGRPRDHLAPRGDGGPQGTHLVDPDEPRGLNRQVTTPRWSDARYKRWSWLRNNLADVAGSGHMPAAEDFNQLPEKHRDRARAIAKRAVEAFSAGDQADALERARADTLALENDLGHAWSPPVAERPIRELLDEIRARSH